MKKRSAMMFLAMIMIPAGPGIAQAAPDNTRITNVQGTAVLLRGGQTIPAAVGTECQTNDILRTNADGVVDVSINNQAGARILASSESSIISTDPENMQLKINSGDLLLNIEKLPKGSTFKVETPTAVATVRGTQFSGHVDIHQPDNPTSTFAVREDAVDVSVIGSGETFTLGEGQALDIPHEAIGHLTPRQAFGTEMANLEQTSTVHTCS